MSGKNCIFKPFIYYCHTFHAAGCLSYYTCRAVTNEAKMLSKLCTNFDQEKEVQKSIYLQFVDRESDGSVIHRAEALECSDGSFKLKEFWCAKPLHTYKADFICLGRYIYSI